MTAGTGYYGKNYLLNSNSDESTFLRYNHDLNHTLYNIYRTNETELTLNEANYFPFTYMYVKDVTDNFATVPAQINNWLYGVMDFSIELLKITFKVTLKPFSTAFSHNLKLNGKSI